MLLILTYITQHIKKPKPHLHKLEQDFTYGTHEGKCRHNHEFHIVTVCTTTCDQPNFMDDIRLIQINRANSSLATYIKKIVLRFLLSVYVRFHTLPYCPRHL